MKIKMRNLLYDRRDSYFFSIPEFVIYEGEEVKLKWLKPNQMALTTGIRDFPERILERSLILEIDGLPYAYDNEPKVQVRTVKGSNGKTYTVTGDHHCTCPGFTFRSNCKHLIKE